MYFFSGLCVYSGSSAVWWRNAPELPAAEVTLGVFRIALCAERGHLLRRPHLIRQAIFRAAIVAEVTCHQAAVNAWPEEHLLVTMGENMESRHVQPRSRTMGWQICCLPWLVA